MIFHEYRCDTCGELFITSTRGDSLPDFCGICGRGTRRRLWSFAYHRGMAEHFNHTVGKPIRSMKQFRDELAREGQKYSELTGLDVNFQPVDPDPAALGVTGEGLDATNRQRVSQGRPPVPDP